MVCDQMKKPCLKAFQWNFLVIEDNFMRGKSCVGVYGCFINSHVVFSRKS